MRLLTHNQLVCVRKGCQNHYPLTLVATRVERQADRGEADEDEEEEEVEEDTEEEAEAKLDFVLHILPNVDYKLGVKDLPGELPEVVSLKKDEHGELLKKLHEVLVETHVVEGALKCDLCGRSYPIQQGIPNMRLNEDEVQ